LANHTINGFRNEQRRGCGLEMMKIGAVHEDRPKVSLLFKVRESAYQKKTIISPLMMPPMPP